MVVFRWIFACAMALATTGCAAQNPYVQFYQPIDNARGLARPIDYSGEPQLLASSGDWAQDELRMYSKGYAPIGAASFNGAKAGQGEAMEQARQLHASHVVVSSTYESTVSGAYAITTPSTDTGTFSGMVGGTPYSGSVTTQGTETMMIPYSINRYDQSAVFFAPLSRAGFGVYLGEVPGEIRAKTGTNAGVYVLAVRDGSPAYNGDIVQGDVLLEVDGQPLSGSNYGSLIAAVIGKPAEFTIWRLGERVSKMVTITTSW